MNKKIIYFLIEHNIYTKLKGTIKRFTNIKD
jgi:hypothetical protein